MGGSISTDQQIENEVNIEEMLAKYSYNLDTEVMLIFEEEEEEQTKNSHSLKKGLENNPNCLLVMKKNNKISRNEKCPATGKKYKHCCGAL